MCVALNEINLSNVKELKQVKFEFGGNEYIANAIPCNTFEEFYSELSKRNDSETIISRGFLVLHFELTQDEAFLLAKNGNEIFFEKVIFTQKKFEIIFERGIHVSLSLCCSLAEEFNVISSANGFQVKPVPYSMISLEFSCLQNAQFSYLCSFNMIYTKVEKLKLSVSILKDYRVKENFVKDFDFSTIYDESIEIPFEMSGTTFGRLDCFFSKKIEKVEVRNCHLLEEVVFITWENIGRLLFENCRSVSKAVFKLERSTVSDRLSLDLDAMPKQFSLPETSVSTDKILEIPILADIPVSTFVPPETLRVNDVEEFMSPSEVQQERLKNSHSTRKNLERAYVLVNNADRNIEALAILEKMLDEKHKSELIQRKLVADKDGCLFHISKKGWFREKWGDLKHWCYRNPLGYFINLKRVLWTLAVVVVVFSLLFSLTPDALKFTKGCGASGWEQFGNCIYFTIVTLTTLGYGDIQPVGIGKYYATFLACIGLFLSGTILAVILRRYSR